MTMTILLCLLPLCSLTILNSTRCWSFKRLDRLFVYVGADKGLVWQVCSQEETLASSAGGNMILPEKLHVISLEAALADHVDLKAVHGGHDRVRAGHSLEHDRVEHGGRARHQHDRNGRQLHDRANQDDQHGR